MCTMNPKLTSGQRLMAESQHMGVEVKVAADKLDRLEVQNAKMRELCADMLAQLLNAYDTKELTEFLDRLHEFGIEVE